MPDLNRRVIYLSPIGAETAWDQAAEILGTSHPPKWRVRCPYQDRYWAFIARYFQYMLTSSHSFPLSYGWLNKLLNEAKLAQEMLGGDLRR